MAGNGASPIEIAVFDYGGVLTTPTRDSIARWLAADGIRPDSFSAVLKRWLSRDAPTGTPIHRLETGQLPIADFESELAEHLRTEDGSPVRPEGLLSRLFAGMHTEPAMLDLVRDLRAAGVRTALLSNSWGDPNRYPRELLGELFEFSAISGELGMRKPDPEIYRYTLDALAAPPERVVFVDDGEPNTEAASRLGMATVLHRDPRRTRARLVEHVPELPNNTEETR